MSDKKQYYEDGKTPVPSYDHFSQLVKKVERLQEQLKEANRIIKKLYKESGNPIGIDYLEKWGVK